jgi:hypothetical protein
VDIDVAKAAGEQQAPVYQLKHFIMASLGRLGQIGEQADDGHTVLQASKSQFADDEGMGKNSSVLQKGDKPFVRIAQMINPYRSVDEDHHRASRDATPRRCLRRRIGSAQSRKPPGAFPFDQSLKCLPHERRPFPDAGESLRFGKKIVVESKGRSHSEVLRHQEWHQMMRISTPAYAPLHFPTSLA